MKRNWRSHYNIVLANLILALATGINFAVIDLMNNNANLLLIAPVISILITAILYYFDVRFFVNDYPYKKFHFNKRWSKFYISGLITYCFEILALFIVMLSGTLVYKNQIMFDSSQDVLQAARQILMIFMWSAFGIVAILGIISFSLMKYARFKIDVELLQRSKGNKTDESKTDSRDVVVDLGDGSTKTPKPQEDNKTQAPSAGLSSL